MADKSVLRQSSLLGRLMLDYDTTNELGLVDGLLIDLAQGKVAALVCQGPLWQRQRPAYRWEQIVNIGQDSIVLHGQGTELSNSAAQPMVGLEVWTDVGNCVGQIADYRFEPNGDVVQYLFAQPDCPGLYGLAPEAIISAGRKRIMVSAQSIDQAEYLPDEDVPTTQQAWQTTAQSLAEQVQQRTQGLSEYAQDTWRSDDLNEQLRSTTQQLRDKTQGLRSQLNQQVSRAKKRLGPLNKALENTVENALDKLSDQKDQTNDPTIDIDSFEVWEDDD